MASFSILSTFPPTRCGLATFAESLATALTASGTDTVQIVRAVNDLDSPTPARVSDHVSIVGELHVNRPGGAPDAARLLSLAEVVVVKHEYGIYGGDDGDDVLRVLEALTAPSIVVLHTVLEQPSSHQRRVLEQIATAATAVVVMSERARSLLATNYRVDMGTVSVIPHGVPDWESLSGGHRSDRSTMLTWGLIGPGKGIEWGIRALALLGDVDPPVHYEVLGQTHPKVIAHEGEAYRESLRRLAEDLGVADRVTFDARYLDRPRLAARVAAADVVLLPYHSREQVTSGVLVEAVAAGKPVVATAFPHAVELLKDGAGMLVEHESPTAIADAVREILAGEVRAGEVHAGEVRPSDRRPVAFDPDTAWSAVARRYRELAESVTSTIARTA